MPFTHFIWLLFDLPNGSIWSNLIASIVWGLGAVLLARIIHNSTVRKLEEHHEKVKDLLNPSTPGGITDLLEKLNGGTSA